MVTNENVMAASSNRQVVLQALADPTRDLIVRLLVDRERSVGEIAEQLPVSRPAVSKHLRLLQRAGLVRFRSEGTRNVYALQPEALAQVRDDIDAMWRHAMARYALLATNAASTETSRRSK
jgi:DNA-binding transcriptional ArsR family regulator